MFNCSNIVSLYVSQKNGNDNWTGFYKEVRDDLNGPLKTIEKALEKVSELRRIGAMQPISVIITDDIYYVKNTVVINENHYGITITSENGCVISGAEKIENFKEDTFNNHKCFSASVEGIEDGKWFTDLYVDDKRADFTRYPKSGLLGAKDVENKSTELGASSKWFVANPEDIKAISGFRNFGDCFISYNHYWIDEHTPIESYDLDSGKIVFKYPSRFSIELTHPASAIEYIIENVGECFENKNEWYLDRETKKVYYIPRNEKQTPENIHVYAPVCDRLFVIAGKKDNKVKNVRFENLTFAHTRGDNEPLTNINCGNDFFNLTEGEDNSQVYASDSQAVSHARATIEFFFASNCYIEKCVLKNIGVHGININEGSHRITIANNDFYDLGAGAMKINGGCYGCEPEEETYGNVVRNNIITDSGNRYFAACGVLIMHSYENTVANNDISYQYYTGISVGWIWGYKDSITRDNLIEKNHIHHLGQGKLSDMGGVYLLGKQQGTIVRNNIIHDIKSKHYGGWALYTDEGSSYITIENNICYNTTGNSYHQHFGCMNTARNNIFVKSKAEPIAVSKPEMHVGIIFEKNIIVADKTASYRSGYEESQYGWVAMLNTSRNLLFNIKEPAYSLNINSKKYSSEEAKNEFGIDTGSIVADPQFTDYENNDFSLKDTSPAYKLGFKKIDISDVGAKRNK